MTVSNVTDLKGSREHRIAWSPTDQANNTSREILGQNNTGMPIHFPCRFTSMYLSGETSGGTITTGNIIMTAYKNSVAGGNKVFEISFFETGVSDNISVETTTPTNSEAVCTFAPGDTLLVVLAANNAPAGTMIEVFCCLTYETDI